MCGDDVIVRGVPHYQSAAAVAVAAGCVDVMYNRCVICRRGVKASDWLAVRYGVDESHEDDSGQCGG